MAAGKRNQPSVIDCAPLSEQRPGNFTQVGAFMQENSLFNRKVVTDELERLPAGSVRVSHPAPARVKLEWPDPAGGGRHIALIASTSAAVQCLYCSQELVVTWCSHLRYLYVNGLDRHLYETTEEFPTYRTIVAVVPTQGVYQRVIVDRVERRGVVMNDVRFDMPSAHFHVASFVGGFGSWEIRALCVDWFSAHWRDPEWFPHDPEAVPAPSGSQEAQLESGLDQWSRTWHAAMTGRSFGATQAAMLGATHPDAPSW